MNVTRKLPLLVCACFALMMLQGVHAAEKPSFQIINNSAASAELRFRNIGLVSRRADDAQNELGLNFTRSVDPELFDQLEHVLPDWIETAFGVHDNGVIHARKPVIFETRNEPDGFSLRITPRVAPVAKEKAPDVRQTLLDDGAPVQVAQRLDPPPPYKLDPRPTAAINQESVALRPSSDVHGQVRRFIVVSLVERPDDQNLLAALALAARRPPLISLWGGFRQNKSGRLAGGGGRFAIPVYDQLKLTGSFGYTDAEGSLVRQMNGALAPFSGHLVKASGGLIYAIDSGTISGEVLIGPEGVGGAITAAVVSSHNDMTFRAAYHEPFDDTVEAIAMGATRDGVSASVAQEIGNGLWAEGEIRGANYAVASDSSVGKTLGFGAGLRYLSEISGLPVSLAYRVDADYVLENDSYPGAAPSPFVPLSLRNREVHRLTAAFTLPLVDDLWLDLHAGYALDRYASGGAFAGGQFRALVSPGVQLIAAGRYSAVSTRLGERGSESLFSLSLALSEP